jgi:hypothetical protein
MMKRKTFGWQKNLLAWLCILAIVVTAVSAQYSVKILPPPAGFNETSGNGIFGVQRVGGARIDGAVYPENTHAFLWIGTSAIDLNPAGYTYSRAYDTDGTRQVGAAWLGGEGVPTRKGAGIWSGTAASFTPLCSDMTCGNYAIALAIGGDQQVGYSDYSDNGGGGLMTTRDIRATLWRGSPESYVDLDPINLGFSDETRALDTDGVQQVGWGYFAYAAHPYKALLWSGTRQSVVDLSPANFDLSFAQAVKKGVQVGYGQNYDQGSLTAPHGLIWFGTAASVVDLGETNILNDTNGRQHVGEGAAGNYLHAFVWTGINSTPLDLHNFLPQDVYIASAAQRIDAAGNIVGWAQRADSYLLEAVVWQTPKRFPKVAATADN